MILCFSAGRLAGGALQNAKLPVARIAMRNGNLPALRIRHSGPAGAKIAQRRRWMAARRRPLNSLTKP
jgi:hypothetical protein